jgi:Cu/Ag efflux pump CusA
MIRRIIEASVKFWVLVIAAAAVVMIVGIGRMHSMPVDVLPEFAPPYIEIQTEALGLSANEVEDLVTLNVEELLAGVPWLKTMRSKSVAGMSSIIMIFEPGIDIWRARQMVQERLTGAYALPNASKAPIMIQPVSATSRVAMIGVSSDTLSLIDLSVLARWTIKPRLLAIPGVANVAVWGDRDRQLQVQFDPDRLAAHGVTQSQIIETTGNSLWISPLTYLEASFPGAGGWLDGPTQRLEVRHVLPISHPEDLARVRISGSSLRLGDVAEVVEGHPPLIGDAVLTDGPGLLLVVEKLPGANTLEVAAGVETALAELQHGLTGVELDPSIYRSATFIETAFANLGQALVIAAVLAIPILGVLLYDWRAAVISVVAIPLALVAVGAVVGMLGGTLNTMVLAGMVIALAVVVDEVILGVDSLRRHQDGTMAAHQIGGLGIAARNGIMMVTHFQHLERQEGMRFGPALVIRGAKERLSPILMTALTTAFGLVPLVIAGNIPGHEIEHPLALVVLGGLITSTLLNLFIVPSLCLRFARPAVAGATA